MAANFWTSSHSKQLLDGEDVGRVLPADQELGLTAEDVKILKIHVATIIQELAKQAKVRQRVVATAIVYFRRVYVKKPFAEYDPRVVGPTCLYLACKAEECTVHQSAKLLVFYLKKMSPEGWPSVEVKDILEMEMHLLEALDFYLVIFHPYRPLVQYLTDAALHKELIETCWSLVNDSYRTDLSLIHPPHMIALACMYMACVLRDKDIRAWFEDLRIDMNVIRSITMELLDYYDTCSSIPRERIAALLVKLPPSRGLQASAATGPT